jgi:hypothetical protein
VGAQDALDEQQIWEWCNMLFGEFSDEDFIQQIQELTKSAVVTSPPQQAESSTQKRRKW